jgi:hypothetical protein
MACTSNCPTQDHENWGQCVKAKGLKIAYANSANGQDATTQKRFDKSLDEYRAARAQGIQPASTRPDAVRRAVEMSNATGEAFRA